MDKKWIKSGQKLERKVVPKGIKFLDEKWSRTGSNFWMKNGPERGQNYMAWLSHPASQLFVATFGLDLAHSAFQHIEIDQESETTLKLLNAVLILTRAILILSSVFILDISLQSILRGLAIVDASCFVSFQQKIYD